MTTTMSEQIDQLAAALAAAQGELLHAAKTSTNPHYRSRYADLSEVLAATRPVLAAHGVAVSQWPGYADGVASVTTLLLHASGQWIRGTCHAPVAREDAQGIGAAVTYLRRYCLAAVAGIAQDDDDGEQAVGPRNAAGATAAAELAAARELVRAQLAALGVRAEDAAQVVADAAGGRRPLSADDYRAVADTLRARRRGQ